MVEKTTSLAKLLVVRSILKDRDGITLQFQDGRYGRFSPDDLNYADLMQLAERSKERQHPVGVDFKEEHAIAELIRAHNDVPKQVMDEDRHRARVFFQGHDGIFSLNLEDRQAACIRGVLEEAIRQNARVWFLFQGTDLALLDVQPAGWVLDHSRNGESDSR
jgi:hypothetical protein